jgi:hypothetical protein
MLAEAQFLVRSAQCSSKKQQEIVWGSLFVCMSRTPGIQDINQGSGRHPYGDFYGEFLQRPN